MLFFDYLFIEFSNFLFSGWSSGPYNEICKIPSQLVKLWGNLESADDYVYKFLFKNIGVSFILHQMFFLQ